eukprot:jgi/Chlat1/1629/Chrsp127S01888
MVGILTLPGAGALGTMAGCTEETKPRVLAAVASVLERAVARNERCAGGVYPGMAYSKLTVFHGLRPPVIGVHSYLERIFKYANCSPSCFIVAYCYIDRLATRHASMPLTSLNVHRLIIAAVMIAAKFLDDAYYNNAYYAKVGGVTTAEMNRLELEFLFRMDFRLTVDPEEYERYAVHLEKQSYLNAFVQSPWASCPPSGFAEKQRYIHADTCAIEAAASRHMMPNPGMLVRVQDDGAAGR